nr:MAG TPA: hypothetical protein [Caudoviricetes sp.]
MPFIQANPNIYFLYTLTLKVIEFTPLLLLLYQMRMKTYATELVVKTHCSIVW